MKVHRQIWEGNSCTKCGHFYAPHTKDGEYYGYSKPCLYCDNPQIGHKVRSQGCLGAFLAIGALVAAIAGIR